MPIAAIIAFFALITGGTSIVAQQAHPDSILYPVKVNVNEKIAAAFTGLEAKIATSVKSDLHREDSSTSLKVAAEVKLGEAGNLITNVRSYVASRRDRFGRPSADAEIELNNAYQVAVEGRAKFNAGAYGEALDMGNRAINLAQKARAIAEALGGMYHTETPVTGSVSAVANTSGASTHVDVQGQVTGSAGTMKTTGEGSVDLRVRL